MSEILLATRESFTTQVNVLTTARVMANELPGMHVHIDDSRVGPVDMLQTIPAQAVSSIRWLSPSEASTKYGNGHTTGVMAFSTLVGKWRRGGSVGSNQRYPVR